jgi:hypothetical protein
MSGTLCVVRLPMTWLALFRVNILPASSASPDFTVRKAKLNLLLFQAAGPLSSIIYSAQTSYNHRFVRFILGIRQIAVKQPPLIID